MQTDSLRIRPPGVDVRGKAQIHTMAKHLQRPYQRDTTETQVHRSLQHLRVASL